MRVYYEITVTKKYIIGKDGDVVLMHDIHAPTAAAAEQLIPELVKRGYQLVTVSELATYKGVKLKKGSVYTRIND